ncbi:hypothetical protein [Caldibacillus thermoamylovorans]|uniref:hypothetical protein n=1 Tax=Caldibacillus thermoamylovorans TaxID=35841 RepID=UPI00203AC2F2|nr:hypothetical protein [Caldibacillus thermoamylovorans]MCM3479257.1 hypothetical protein [Caldibacillus thermoamylovorans]
MEKYSTKELCEQVLKIKYDTFTAHKKKYLDKLRLAYEVHIKKENGTDYYYLVPKNNLYNILGCDIGKRDINIIESILKVIMEGNVVPVRDEIGKAINVPAGTVRGYINFLKKHEIIAKPKIEEFVVVNQDGEIVREYKKKKVAYVYYDIQADGSRVKLPQQNMIHNKHGNLWKEKYDNQDYLHLVIRNLNYQPLASVLRKDVWEEINSTFGLNKGARIEMLFINSDIRQQLQEYFNKAG